MPAFPWLPVGFQLPAGARVGRVLAEGPGYQIVSSFEGQETALLIMVGSIAGDYVMDETGAAATLATGVDFWAVTYGRFALLTAVFSPDETPLRLGDRPGWPEFLARDQARTLARGLARLNADKPDTSWTEALFFPGAGLCLPTAENTPAEDRWNLAIRLLTGGPAGLDLALEAIPELNRELDLATVHYFMATLGLVRTSPGPGTQVAISRPPITAFSLPGRPALETFFRDYILDYHEHPDRYAALGVSPPGAVLLSGPPGTGKTFAVRRLAASLGWPVFELNLGRIGSTYIHQTSVTLREIFDAAAAQAPSLVLLDEVDAWAMARDTRIHEHKIEEITELLGLIEGAASRGILVLATTNRPEALDPALRRKGRLDREIELDYPNKDEVLAALEDLLAGRPCAPGLKLELAAHKLAGRPMSDLAWVVDEAARAAARAGKEMIDDLVFFAALSKLKS